MPSARRVRWARIRVISVCIAALAILTVLCYLLTGGTLLQETVALYLYVPDATGLTPGSLVRVDGIDVGKVVSVGLSGSRQADRVVKVVLSVKRSRLASITSDSTAEIDADTLIGDKFVAITSHRSPIHIRAGGEIPFKAAPNMMARLDLRQFEQQLRIVEATLVDIEGGRNQLGQFILGDQMYRDLLRRLSQLQAGIRRAVNTTGAVGEAIYTDTLYRQIATPLNELDRALARFGSERWMRDTGQYEQLLRATTGLRKSIADLRAGSFFQSDDLYVGWNRGLASLIQQVDRMNASPLFNSAEVYESLDGWAREMENSVRDFREHPQKYLRLKVF